MSKHKSIPNTPKFIELVREFPENERIKLSKWIQDNANNELLPKIVEVLKESGIFNDKKYNNALVKKKIYAIKSFPKKKQSIILSTYMKELNDLAERFLVPKTPKFIELVRKFPKNKRTKLSKLISKNESNRILSIIVEELKKANIFESTAFDIVVVRKIFQHIQHGSFKKKLKELTDYMRQLNKMAEQFLLQEGLERNPAYQQELLIKELLAINLFSRAEFFIKKMQQSITSTTKSFENFALSLKVEEVKNQSILKQGLILKQDGFSELAQQLDSYYLLYKLRIFSSILSLQNINTKKFTFNDNSIKSLQKTYQFVPLINVYSLSNKVQQDKQEKDVNKLLAFLKLQFHQLPKEDLSNFYRVICNFYIEQMIQKDKRAKKKLLALYQQIEPKGLLFNEKIIQIVSLANIISLSCQEGDFVWAIALYNKYYSKIRKKERKNYDHLINGIIAYYRKNYEKAKTHLMELESTNSQYKVAYRMLQIKVLYETDKFQDKGTLTIFESQEKFYDRNNLMNQKRKTGFKNFITILKKLYKAKHSHSFKYPFEILNDLELVRKTLSQQKFNADEEWLLRKFKELETHYSK